jgi:hypothetical protein
MELPDLLSLSGSCEINSTGTSVSRSTLIQVSAILIMMCLASYLKNNFLSICNKDGAPSAIVKTFS